MILYVLPDEKNNAQPYPGGKPEKYINDRPENTCSLV